MLSESHHYTHVNSPRQLYITYLNTAVALDLLDTIFFLDLLWQNQVGRYVLIVTKIASRKTPEVKNEWDRFEEKRVQVHTTQQQKREIAIKVLKVF